MVSLGEDLAVETASDEQAIAIAVKLNLAMCRLWPESRSQSTYFRLFRHMDRDNSGLISFYELRKAVRELLRIPPDKMGEPELLGLIDPTRLLADPPTARWAATAHSLKVAKRGCRTSGETTPSAGMRSVQKASEREPSRCRWSL